MFLFRCVFIICAFILVYCECFIFNFLYSLRNKYITRCSGHFLKYDFGDLQIDLKENVFGQPFVNKMIVPILKTHVYNDNPKSALAISLHGPTGCGKNYVADMIVKHLYLEGYDSPNVHKFVRADFGSDSNIKEQQIILKTRIISSVGNCEHAMFIFDEVESFPGGLLNIITSFLDNNMLIQGINFRKSVFIFLSNIGDKAINMKAYDLFKSGLSRDEFDINAFNNLISDTSMNSDGGFHKSSVIDHFLIDHFIPFLPLERKHVSRCIDHIIHTLYDNHDQVKKNKNELIENVIQALQFGPNPDNLFAVSGCKLIESTFERERINLIYKNIKDEF